MEQVSREEWFKTVDSVAYMWDRLSADKLVVHFPGYKCENYFLGQNAMLKLGGWVMSVDFDKHSGCTVCVVREPRNLEKPE